MTDLPTPAGYERVETPYGPYLRRIGTKIPELQHAFMLRKLKRMNFPPRRWFARHLLRRVERLDGWLHGHGWHLEPLCFVIDWGNGMSAGALFREWIRHPWRVVSYSRPDRGD